MSLLSFVETSALIRHRRSIKPVDFDPTRMIDPSLLIELLENASWAPTHGLTEPWRFIVFQGAARARLAAVQQALYLETTPVSEFREDKHRKLGETPLLAPVVIACVMERQRGGKISEMDEIAAVSAAIQNLLLSATAAGLGSFWASPALMSAPGFQAFLGIRAEDRCLGLIYLGWPKLGFTWPRSTRRSVESKTHWHHD